MNTLAKRAFLTLAAVMLLPAFGLGAEPAAFKYMQFGNCRATSDTPDPRVHGFAQSDNQSLPIAADAVFKHEPYLVVDQESSALFAGKYQSLSVRLVNGGDSLLQLEALDSHLYLIQEAQDRLGRWKPIEFLATDCANSLHRVTLGPMRYWEFIAPKYSGPRQTLLRFKLVLANGEVLYSDAFPGSIHPAQFKRPKLR